jgi:Ni/Fe-hydrogenase 1 B-type cytochrome subunit
MQVHPHCQYKTYIWEFPVRLSHWVNVLSIVVLALTGLFIGSPRSLALNPSQYIMGWVRLIHFTTAYILTISMAIRVYWSFVGNRYASYRGFFPALTADGRSRMKEIFNYYTFRSRKVPEIEGHNPMAATAYFGVFLCYLTMIFTGFALYAEHAPQGIMHRLLGFMYMLFSNQGMRLTHHITMWLILSFVINHIYSAWLMDIKERDGEISSIFSGSKFITRKEN